MGKRHSFRRRGHRRSNPNIGGFSTTELVKLALGAGAGVIGSKYAAQVALGANNSGVVGYAAQAIATLALGWLANKFAGKDAATGVVAGGLGAVALRIYNDNMSGSSMAAGAMSGLGDPDMGRLGIGLSGYGSGSMSVPASFSQPPAIVVAPRGRG